jgi:hypothetical protein
MSPGTMFTDRFPGPRLVPGTWLPHYLPAWSSLEATQASLRVDDVGSAWTCRSITRSSAPASTSRRCSHRPRIGQLVGSGGHPVRPAEVIDVAGAGQILEEAIESRVGLHTDAHPARAR